MSDIDKNIEKQVAAGDNVNNIGSLSDTDVVDFDGADNGSVGSIDGVTGNIDNTDNLADIDGTTNTNGSVDVDTERGEDSASDKSASGAEDCDDSNLEINISSVIEALLFATDEPVTPAKLVDMTGADGVRQVRSYIKELNDKYAANNCAFRIEQIAGGYQMLTLGEFNVWLRKLVKVRSENKLSPAALETLAIIAYKQPIMRVDIEAIRGVACGEMVRQLIDKGLVKIAGRAQVLGRPLLYGTTKRFLDVFGLNSLKDLPTAEDLKKPD